MFEDVRLQRAQLAPMAQAHHRRVGVYSHSLNAVCSERPEQFAAPAKEIERHIAFAQQLTEQRQTAKAEGFPVQVSRFVGGVIERPREGTLISAELARHLEASFIG